MGKKAKRKQPRKTAKAAPQLPQLRALPGVEIDPNTASWHPERTVRAREPLTVDSLKLAVRVLPFRYAEGEKELGWEPQKKARIFVEQNSEGRWRIIGLILMDQSNFQLFRADLADMPDMGPVLLTQRGEEKTYASADALFQDFKRILGRRGTVEVSWFFNDQLKDKR